AGRNPVERAPFGKGQDLIITERRWRVEREYSLPLWRLAPAFRMLGHVAGPLNDQASHKKKKARPVRYTVDGPGIPLSRTRRFFGRLNQFRRATLYPLLYPRTNSGGICQAAPDNANLPAAIAGVKMRAD